MAAMMHGLVAGGPPVGAGGIFSLRDPSELAALAKRQGFVEVNVEEIPITSHADSIEAQVARVSSLAGPLAAVFASASLEQLADVHKTATQLAAVRLRRSGRLRSDVLALGQEAQKARIRTTLTPGSVVVSWAWLIGIVKHELHGFDSPFISWDRSGGEEHGRSRRVPAQTRTNLSCIALDNGRRFPLPRGRVAFRLHLLRPLDTCRAGPSPP